MKATMKASVAFMSRDRSSIRCTISGALVASMASMSIASSCVSGHGTAGPAWRERNVLEREGLAG